MGEVSRSLFAYGLQDETDIQNDYAYSFSRLKGRWIQIPYTLLLARKWISLANPLLAPPYTGQKAMATLPDQRENLFS